MLVLFYSYERQFHMNISKRIDVWELPCLRALAVHNCFNTHLILLVIYLVVYCKCGNTKHNQNVCMGVCKCDDPETIFSLKLLYL